MTKISSRPSAPGARETSAPPSSAEGAALRAANGASAPADGDLAASAKVRLTETPVFLETRDFSAPVGGSDSAAKFGDATPQVQTPQELVSIGQRKSEIMARPPEVWSGCQNVDFPVNQAQVDAAQALRK
jgi:hypothetical protein